MSGVILATAIGGTAVSTGALVAAGIGAGTTLYGGAKSFSDANKARKRGEAAKRAADKAIEEAKRRVDVNVYEQLSIAKEPYELMREALLTQGATGLQTGVEGETRGAAATAGRIQMAQNQQQSAIRAEQAQQMDVLNKLVADEDKRRQQQLAGIAMEESAGAQLAIRDAEEDRANYIAQGVGTLGSIAQGLSSSYAAGDFGRIKARGLAEESENVGELMAGLDAFGMPTARQQRRAERAAQRTQAGNMVDSSQPLSRDEFARRQAEAAAFVPYAQELRNRPSEEEQWRDFVGLSVLDRDNVVISPVSAVQSGPLAVPESFPVSTAFSAPRTGPRPLPQYQPGRQGTSGPLDPFDPFGGGGFTPPSPVNATRGEASASVAPAGLGSAPQRLQPRQAQVMANQTPTSQFQGSRTQSPVDRSFGGGSYYNGKGNNEQASIEELARILKKEEGLTDAEVEIAKKRFEIERDGSAGFSMPPRELEDEYFNREPQAGGRAQVQSVGQSTVVRELLDELAGKESQEVVAPDPTPKQLEEVTTKSVESAASVGPATEEVVRQVTEDTTPGNPLPIAMQWLGVNELDPEGVELRSTLWSTIHGKADTSAMVDDNWAWCAAFVNHTLVEAGADTLETDDKYNKGRAKAYETFGQSVKGSNTKDMLSNAKEGDIVVKKKMVPVLDENGQPTGKMKVQYHVGFFAGYDAENGTVNLLGGNQQDEVNITAYPIEQVTAVRRIRVDGLTDEQKEAMSKIMIKQEGATR